MAVGTAVCVDGMDGEQRRYTTAVCLHALDGLGGLRWMDGLGGRLSPQMWDCMQGG